MSRLEKLYIVFVEYEKTQIAKRMLKCGETVENIAYCTELDIETITELQKELETEE